MPRNASSSLRTDGSVADQPVRNPHETADFVLEMSAQLGAMSSAAGLTMLAYLLDMVRIEAELVKKRIPPAPSVPTRRGRDHWGE